MNIMNNVLYRAIESYLKEDPNNEKKLMNFISYQYKIKDRKNYVGICFDYLGSVNIIIFNCIDKFEKSFYYDYELYEKFGIEIPIDFGSKLQIDYIIDPKSEMLYDKILHSDNFKIVQQTDIRDERHPEYWNDPYPYNSVDDMINDNIFKGDYVMSKFKPEIYCKNIADLLSNK